MSAEPSGSNPRSRPPPDPIDAPLSDVALGEGTILGPWCGGPKRLLWLFFRPLVELIYPIPCSLKTSAPRSLPGTGGRGCFSWLLYVAVAELLLLLLLLLLSHD